MEDEAYSCYEVDPEEAAMVKFDDNITFVESIVSLTHGERVITPSNMMICLVDDDNLRNFAIMRTGARDWIQFVRDCIRHYDLKHGKWADHMRENAERMVGR